MTIQSLMSNKGSLILASDLAVTMDDYKSYIGVKKVFEIKKDIPVGIMINGLIDFEEIPLETLIGEFFENIDDLNSVKNIEEEFIKFLSKHTNYTPIEDYIKEVLKSFKERLCETIEEDGFENTIKNKTSRNIQEFLRNYSNFENEFYDLIPPGFVELPQPCKRSRILTSRAGTFPRK